jgi:hypothetical protein
MKNHFIKIFPTIILTIYFVSINIDTSISRIILIPVFFIGLKNIFKNLNNCREETKKIFIIQSIYFIGFLALPIIDPLFRIRDMDHASRFILYIPVFSYFLTSRIIKFNRVVLISSLIFSLIYIIISYFGIILTTLTTKIDTAQILLVLGVFNYYYYIKKRSLLYLITTLINYSIIVDLEVRSVILYSILMPVILEFFICNKSDLNLLKFKRISIIYGITFISIFFSEGAKLRLVNAVNSTAIHFNSEEVNSESKNSVNYRIEYFENGVIDFFSSPFFGIGRTGAVESINQNVQFYGRERFSHHHNELISTLCMRGSFGLIFLILYFYLIFNLIKHNPHLTNKSDSSLLLIMLISQITFFIFDSPFIGSMKSVDFFLITFFALYAQFVKKKYLNE